MESMKIRVLQNNIALFGQLYISMQSRDCDLREFFAHAIQSFLPSLSDLGKLHLTNTKSEILKCFEQPVYPEPPSVYDSAVQDDAVIVHCLPTTGVSIFNEYTEKIIYSLPE